MLILPWWCLLRGVAGVKKGVSTSKEKVYWRSLVPAPDQLCRWACTRELKMGRISRALFCPLCELSPRRFSVTRHTSPPSPHTRLPPPFSQLRIGWARGLAQQRTCSAAAAALSPPTPPPPPLLLPPHPRVPPSTAPPPALPLRRLFPSPPPTCRKRSPPLRKTYFLKWTDCEEAR